MREEIIDILVNSQRNYNNFSLRKIREIEKCFTFDSINDVDVTKLGECIKNELINKNREFSIRISNLNNIDIYVFLSSKKALRNIEFGKKKGNVVRICKHVSFYPLIMYAMGFEDISFFDNDDILTVAGGFPIYENNELKYIVEISGFKNGDDYRLYIKAFEKFIGQEIPEFDFYLI